MASPWNRHAATTSYRAGYDSESLEPGGAGALIDANKAACCFLRSAANDAARLSRAEGGGRGGFTAARLSRAEGGGRGGFTMSTSAAEKRNSVLWMDAQVSHHTTDSHKRRRKKSKQ